MRRQGKHEDKTLLLTFRPHPITQENFLRPHLLFIYLFLFAFGKTDRTRRCPGFRRKLLNYRRRRRIGEMRTVEKKKRRKEKGFSKKRDPLEATRKIEEDVSILLTICVALETVFPCQKRWICPSFLHLDSAWFVLTSFPVRRKYRRNNKAFFPSGLGVHYPAIHPGFFPS